MKKKVYYSMHQHPGVKVPTHDFGPSITQPDDSMTIQQILDRVRHGLTTGLGASRSDDDYDDPNDDDYDDPTIQPGFDKLDALSIATSDDTYDKRDRIEAAKEKKKKDKAKAEFDKAVEDEINRRKQEEEPK